MIALPGGTLALALGWGMPPVPSGPWSEPTALVCSARPERYPSPLQRASDLVRGSTEDYDLYVASALFHEHQGVLWLGDELSLSRYDPNGDSFRSQPVSIGEAGLVTTDLLERDPMQASHGAASGFIGGAYVAVRIEQLGGCGGDGRPECVMSVRRRWLDQIESSEQELHVRLSRNLELNQSFELRGLVDVLSGGTTVAGLAWGDQRTAAGRVSIVLPIPRTPIDTLVDAPWSWWNTVVAAMVQWGQYPSMPLRGLPEAVERVERVTVRGEAWLVLATRGRRLCAWQPWTDEPPQLLARESTAWSTIRGDPDGGVILFGIPESGESHRWCFDRATSAPATERQEIVRLQAQRDGAAGWRSTRVWSPVDDGIEGQVDVEHVGALTRNSYLMSFRQPVDVPGRAPAIPGDAPLPGIRVARLVAGPDGLHHLVELPHWESRDDPRRILATYVDVAGRQWAIVSPAQSGAGTRSGNQLRRIDHPTTRVADLVGHPVLAPVPFSDGAAFAMQVGETFWIGVLRPGMDEPSWVQAGPMVALLGHDASLVSVERDGAGYRAFHWTLDGSGVPGRRPLPVAVRGDGAELDFWYDGGGVVDAWPMDAGCAPPTFIPGYVGGERVCRDPQTSSYFLESHRWREVVPAASGGWWRWILEGGGSTLRQAGPRSEGAGEPVFEVADPAMASVRPLFFANGPGKEPMLLGRHDGGLVAMFPQVQGWIPCFGAEPTVVQRAPGLAFADVAEPCSVPWVRGGPIGAWLDGGDRLWLAVGGTVPSWYLGPGIPRRRVWSGRAEGLSRGRLEAAAPMTPTNVWSSCADGWRTMGPEGIPIDVSTGILYVDCAIKAGDRDGYWVRDYPRQPVWSTYRAGALTAIVGLLLGPALWVYPRKVVPVLDKWQRGAINSFNHVGDPVSGNRFVGRYAEMGRLEIHARSGTNVWLFGPTRIGKSSILREIERRLRHNLVLDPGVTAVIVAMSMEVAFDGSRFFRTLLHHFITECQRQRLPHRHLAEPRDEDQAYAWLRRLIDDFRAAGVRAIVVLDEVQRLIAPDAGGAAEDARAKLRDLLQRYSPAEGEVRALMLVGAGVTVPYRGFDSDIVRLGDVIRVGVMEHEQVRHLLTRPVSATRSVMFAGSAVDLLVERGHNEPHLIQVWGREALHIALHEEPGRSRRTRLILTVERRHAEIAIERRAAEDVLGRPVITSLEGPSRGT